MRPQPPFAEYPRAEGARQRRGPGVYFEAIGEAWDLVRRELGTWVAASVVFLALFYGLSLPIFLIVAPMIPQNPFADDYFAKLLPVALLEVVLFALPIGVCQTLTTGMIAMGIRQSKGEYIDVGMVFQPFRRFGSIFVTSLLQSAILLASQLLCLLPFFFMFPVLVLMPTVGYLRNLKPLDALTTTFDACKSHWLGLLGLLFVVGIVAGLGICACFVGWLVTLPIVFVTLSIHYRAFFEASEPTFVNVAPTGR